ncbi:hypothetical protein [Dactylosporangium sp. NPDC051541]|uniref:hypothetical protein n=1 Tax=Dactylosporangium sp. NPDC051541 TaxID=3363977 RepID=UPI00379905BD
MTTELRPVRASTAVSKRMAAWAHMSAAFADEVFAELVAPSVRAGAPAVGVDLLLLARHAALARRRRRHLNLALTGLLAATVLLPIAGIVAGRFADLSGLALLALVASFALVAWFEYGRHVIVRHLTSFGFDEPAAAPALPGTVERRIQRQMTANVVVFNGADRFAAWGGSVERLQFTVDITKGAIVAGGHRRAVAPVRVAELYGTLVGAVGAHEVPRLRVHTLLFVGGEAIDEVPGLRPDRTGRPDSTVDPELLDLGADRPRPEVCTYVCIEKSTWGGDIVTSLFVRAELRGGLLLVTCDFALLPSLRIELPAVQTALAPMVARIAIGSTLRRMLVSPGVLLREASRWVHARRVSHRQRRALLRGDRTDLGAGRGLRAAVAMDRLSPTVLRDAASDFRTMQRYARDTIRGFLVQHGIDTTDFDAGSYEAKIGLAVAAIKTLNAHAVTFGESSVASLGTPVSGPAPAGPGAYRPQRISLPTASPAPPPHSGSRASPKPSEHIRPELGRRSDWRGRLAAWLSIPVTDEAARIVAFDNFEQRMAAITTALGPPPDDGREESDHG